MDYQSLIDKYYPLDNELKRILLVHSRSVAAMALRICEAHPELSLDKQFVEEAAMLHDIGIFRCNAPGIQCFGTKPYICHGQLGAEILRAEGFPRHARVCERHTGAGLSMTDIQSQHLPIIVPPVPSAEQDNTFWEPFLPETLEEKLICYADKFFSKTRLDNQKTVEQAEKSLAKFGDAGVHRFREWRQLFE